MDYLSCLWVWILLFLARSHDRHRHGIFMTQISMFNDVLKCHNIHTKQGNTIEMNADNEFCLIETVYKLLVYRNVS